MFGQKFKRIGQWRLPLPCLWSNCPIQWVFHLERLTPGFCVIIKWETAKASFTWNSTLLLPHLKLTAFLVWNLLKILYLDFWWIFRFKCDLSRVGLNMGFWQCSHWVECVRGGVVKKLSKMENKSIKTKETLSLMQSAWHKSWQGGPSGSSLCASGFSRLAPSTAPTLPRWYRMLVDVVPGYVFPYSSTITYWRGEEMFEIKRGQVLKKEVKTEWLEALSIHGWCLPSWFAQQRGGRMIKWNVC